MKRLALVLVAVAMLAGCKLDPPTVKDVQRESVFFYITRPDGTRMECVMFGADSGRFVSQSKSWFSFTCDWAAR